MNAVFNGETYSYSDARARAPEARGRKGLGHFEKGDPAKHGQAGRWIYVCPDGYAVPVLENAGKPDPPPLPKLNPEKATCHCGPHTCSACGTDYFLEIHGVADGLCTFCYYRG